MLEQSESVARALVGALVLGALTSAACGGAGPEAKSARKRQHAVAVNPFPTRDALAKIAAAPVAETPARSVASAPEWSVEIATQDAPSPAESRFAQVAVKEGATLTFAKELRCVARELGRFQVEQGAPPNERLKRFMVAACGITNPMIGAMSQTGNATADVSDERLLAQWQKTLTISPELKGKALGVWMARKKDRVVIMTAYAPPRPDVVVDPVDAAGAFTVRGTAPANTEHVLGLVNQADGVATCVQDPATPLPLFAFRCQMAAEDKTAWVEVAVRAQGRLILHSTALALVRRDPAAPLQYVALAHAPAAAGGGDLRGAILQGINRARVASKLGGLELAPEQTTTNDRLAPQFFAASYANDAAKGDLVGLGLIAGWDVQGTIKHGNLFSAVISGTTDANAWLDYALESPMGRYTLLQSDAQQIAIGLPPAAGAGGVGGVGAVVTTYDLFGSDDHRQDAVQVFAQLAKARADRGLPPPSRLGSGRDLAQQASLLRQGKIDTEDALDAVLVGVRDKSGQSVRGWALTGSDLDALAFPPELLGAGPLKVAVEVTHHKEEGAAWGAYVVFIVAPGAGDGAVSTPQIQASGTTIARSL